MSKPVSKVVVRNSAKTIVHKTRSTEEDLETLLAETRVLIDPRVVKGELSSVEVSGYVDGTRVTVFNLDKTTVDRINQ